MKNFWKDNIYFKISLYAIFVAAMTILFYRFSSNTDNIAPSIIAFIRAVAKVLLPILYGLLLSYLLNPIMMFFEKYYLKWFKPQTSKQKRSIRTLSIFTVYVSIIGLLILMIRYLVPQIYENIKELIEVAPQYIESIDNKFTAFELSLADNMTTLPFNFDIKEVFSKFSLEHYFNASLINNMVSGIMTKALTLTSSLYNWIMGLVIAFYALTQKEDFARGTKRLTYALLSKERASKIIAVFSEGHAIFIRFFVGKFIDSFIIGVICFIGLTMMKNPYALLLAVIVGIFNMIPYFGPILGGVPAVIITLFTGFMPAVFVAIFIFILQQFDGMVLGPKILGDSIGLSPFWIVSGIIIGGALWGPLGMFFASPIIAVMLKNIERWIQKRLAAKHIPEEAIHVTQPEPPINPTFSFKRKNKDHKSK